MLIGSIGATAIPIGKSQAADYQITGLSAQLFFHDRAQFSEDILSQPNLDLWNTPTGAGQAGGPSISTLVTVEVSGPPERFVAGRRVELLVTSGGKIRFKRSIETPVLSDQGKVYIAFWLYDTGCEPLDLSARLTGQTHSSEKSGHIKFACGE